MLIEKFDPAGHVIVFRSKARADDVHGRNKLDIQFMETRKELLSEMPQLLRNSTRLIFHSFPVSRSLFFWYRYRNLMPETVWSVWGQDAYWYNYAEKSFENKVYEWIRGRLIKNVDAVLCPIRGDYQYIKTHYDTNASYINGMYPIPSDFQVLKGLRKNHDRHQTVNIQVGNSATPTNNTGEVLEYFSRFPAKNLRVYCPLSYGDRGYAGKVRNIGEKLLGERFIPILTFMDREAYARFIASMDVLIMNHQRQQGLGNIFSYLYLGKKVYIRSDNPSYPFFAENGLQVHDTIQLMKKDNLDSLTDLDEAIAESNMIKAGSIVSIDNISKGWSTILNVKVQSD